MATTELLSAFLKDNYYSIAVTVFVASLVYLLVFDEKEEMIKPAAEDNPVGEEQNPRVVSQTAKKIEAEKEAAKVVAAEKEEQDFLQEQRNKMKQSAPEIPIPPQVQPAVVTSPSDSSETSVLTPLLVVPNALVYGFTLGQVNLMEQSPSPQTTPAKA